MRMNSLTTMAGLGCVLVALVSGCASPCEPIPESEPVKRLGFVLDGGRVCKDEKSVATVDYPEADAGALTKQHQDKLSGAGWEVENPSEGVVYATKDSDTLFIVTGKKSEDRRVPFAIVRYCESEACRQPLADLAQAMKKY